MKARRLKNLRVRRVDLVESGANQGAHVVLFKSATLKQEPPMMECPKCGAEAKKDAKFCPECGASMDQAQAAKSATGGNMPLTEEQAKKLKDDAEAAMKLAKDAEDKRVELEKSMKTQGETIETLKKRLDASDAEVQKARDETKLASFKKTVDAFEHLPVKADVFGPVLMKCAGALSEDENKELMRVLKAADAASAERFVEIGASGHGTGEQSAVAQLEVKAKELITASAGKITEQEAFAKAAQMNPRLAERARKESYAARSDN